MSDEMVTDGVDGIRTTRMLERAVRQRWPIPEEYKAAIIKRQAKIAVDPKSTARESASAAKTYCWQWGNPVALEPIYCRGQQGLRTPAADVMEAVREQLHGNSDFVKTLGLEGL